MPSAGDFYDELKGTNSRLDNLIGVTEMVRDGVQELDAGIDQLVSLQGFANSALTHQIRQNDTIICLLRQIADHTCRLLNEATTQTALQSSIAVDADTLAALSTLTHPEAALVRQREQELQARIDECCPPEETPPACRPVECPDPGRFDAGVILSERPPRGKRTRRPASPE